jgi:fructose-1,6-bisphosphatase/inositol monophosphatase family enzyme
MMILKKKTEITIAIVKSAGALALKFFHDVANLNVERKGHQDFVSRADNHRGCAGSPLGRQRATCDPGV